MKHAFGNQLVDRGAGLKGWVQLDERVRPKDACFELAANVLLDLPIADLDEAPGVACVVVDKPVAEVEDVHSRTQAPGHARLDSRPVVPDSIAHGAIHLRTSWAPGAQVSIPSQLPVRCQGLLYLGSASVARRAVPTCGGRGGTGQKPVPFVTAAEDVRPSRRATWIRADRG